MNDSQCSSMIDRIQKEYDREKENVAPLGNAHVRAILLAVEALVEIDRSLQVFVDEFQRDRGEREAVEKKWREEESSDD